MKISHATTLKICQSHEIILNLPEYFFTPLKYHTYLEHFSTPSIFRNPPPPSPPPKKSQPLPDIISTLLKKSQPLPKKSQPLPKKSQPPPEKMYPSRKNVNPASQIIHNPTRKNLKPAHQKIANPSRKNVTSTEKIYPPPPK